MFKNSYNSVRNILTCALLKLKNNKFIKAYCFSYIYYSNRYLPAIYLLLAYIAFKSAFDAAIVTYLTDY